MCSWHKPMVTLKTKGCVLLISVEIVIYMEETCMKSEPFLIYHTSKVYFQVDKCHKYGKKILKHVHNCIEKYPHGFWIKLSLMRPKKKTPPLIIMFDYITLEHLCLLKDTTE